jgi:4-hydroxymandelate oxidase
MDRSYFDYFGSGANDEITLKANVADYQRIRLAPRVLVDVSARDPRTSVLGQELAIPLLIAPMAFQKLAHQDGEVATARAAAAAGVGMVLSTFTTSTLSDVRRATSGPLWFQLYMYKDREQTKVLVQLAENEGYSALVLTVDAPVIGRRERDIRSGVRLPDHVNAVNALSDASRDGGGTGSGLADFVTQQIDDALQWSDIDWLRSITRLPIVVKGIQRGDDAARAAEIGVNAMVVSNHGARQLDPARSTITTLPEVADAVDGRSEILIDGGVRRGTDIIKAIAWGASAVLLGRPVLWGLATGGEEGVAEVLNLIRNEFDTALALCGCTDVASITPDLVANTRPDARSSLYLGI